MLDSKPVLLVRSLNKKYGDGCGCCEAFSGPQAGTNVCSACKTVHALRDVSLDLFQGEILGIVGESGSGKSTLVQCLYFDVEASGGEVFLPSCASGKDNILKLPRHSRRSIRNTVMGMVYQNPLRGLRLGITSGGNVAEKLLDASVYHFRTIRNRVEELINRTEIPIYYTDVLPRRLSGGMQQRIQIAKALANNPPILFLDEVTSGLDVSVQARVLDLIKALQDELKISMLIVSHDIGIIRLLTERVIVMKNGMIVEQGLTDQILEDPQHAYTQLLVHSAL